MAFVVKAIESPLLWDCANHLLHPIGLRMFQRRAKTDAVRHSCHELIEVCLKKGGEMSRYVRTNLLKNQQIHEMSVFRILR